MVTPKNLTQLVPEIEREKGKEREREREGEKERERETDRDPIPFVSSKEEPREPEHTFLYPLDQVTWGMGEATLKMASYSTKGGWHYLDQFSLNFYKPYFLLFYLSGYETSVPLTLRHFK